MISGIYKIMKYLLIFIMSCSAQAACYTDILGNVTCFEAQQQYIDIRNSSNSPIIIENGKYRGNLNNNQLDPNSINNPLGKYGNPMSQESILNPFRSR